MKGLRWLVGVMVVALFAQAAVVAYVVEYFEEQRDRDCLRTLENRAVSTEARVHDWEEALNIFAEDPDPELLEEMDRHLDGIRARDAALPPPATCED